MVNGTCSHMCMVTNSGFGHISLVCMHSISRQVLTNGLFTLHGPGNGK